MLQEMEDLDEEMEVEGEQRKVDAKTVLKHKIEKAADQRLVDEVNP